MLFRRKKNAPPVWTQEEEDLAYEEFLEACKSFPGESFISDEELGRIHDQIFGKPKPRNILRKKKFWVIAAAAAAVLGTITTAAAFQNQIRRFLLHESRIATDVEVLPPDDGENSETISYYWDAEYIPEGYTLGYENISELTSFIAYDSSEGLSIDILTMPLSATPSIDTEDTQKQEIVIADRPGYLYTTMDDSKTRLFILYEDCFTIISGEIPQLELLKIAESLHKVNIP